MTSPAVWTQRHPSVVVTGFLLCLLTAVGSITAALLIRDEQKKTDAAYQRERERARQAEERFQLAQRTADKLRQFAEKEMADDPQFQGLRKRMLEAVLEDYQNFIEQRRDDPDAQAALAEMRNEVQNILDDLTVLQGAGQIVLLREAAVLDDLKATAEQWQQLRSGDEELNGQRAEAFDHRKSPEERRRSFLKLVKDEEALLARVFSKEQVLRLRQIALQSKGNGAFRETEVIARLKLTPRQQEDIRALDEGMHRDFRPGPQQEGKPGKNPDEIRKVATEKILALLT